MTEPKPLLDPTATSANQSMSAVGTTVAERPRIIEVWESDEEGQAPNILTLDLVGLGGDAYITADLDDEDDDITTLSTHTLRVEEGLRGQGLGERLVRALGYVGVERGCDEIEVEFDHPASVKHFIRVFGPDRVHIHDQFNRNAPLNEEEAIQVINRRRANAQVTIGGKQTVDVNRVHGPKGWVDLAGLDTSGWEVPEVVAAAEAPWNVEENAQE